MDILSLAGIAITVIHLDSIIMLDLDIWSFHNDTEQLQKEIKKLELQHAKNGLEYS